LAELEVSLVAADRKVWGGRATIVIAKTTDGDVGVMSGHQPILSVLVEGVVTIRQVEGPAVLAAVHGGFLSVAGNTVSILAEIAELSGEIDVARAEEALQRAQAGGDEVAVERAETRLRVAGRN
jgi:F-type H+-transporting ATPase subunit epsilon